MTHTFFSNPFGNLDAARRAPLRIDNALITPLPSQRSGMRVAITLFVFMGIYFVTAAVFLPETKGKTLEEIEAHFEGAGN